MKKIMNLLIILVISFNTYSQEGIKIAIPLFENYKNPIYSIFFTSNSSFLATVKIKDIEYVKKFSIKNYQILDEGFVSNYQNLAIGGQINGRPYLYRKDKGDVIPGYPEETSISFDTYEEEVFVSGYLENILIISRNKESLDICKVTDNWRKRYEPISNLSNPNLDENGIHVIWDTLFFSRKDSLSGDYKLYKSIRKDNIYGEEEWSNPEKLPHPYNIDDASTLFYVWYEGIEYITSNRDGILKIYAIGNKQIIKEKWGNLYEEYVSSNNYGHYSNTVNLTDSMHDENQSKLKRKIRGKTYEEYVSANNYGFYNNILTLTDSMHTTRYIIDDPTEDITDKTINIIHIIDIINHEKDWYVGKTSNNEIITLIPVEIAIEAKINVDKNLIKSDNIIQNEYKFLANKYVVCKETDISPIKKDYISTDELKNIILSEKEFSEEELILLFKRWNYNSCFVQIGFYTKKQPSVSFENVLLNKYPVNKSARFVNNKKVGTQYYIESSIERSFNILKFTIERFYYKGIDDEPFIRIGDWNDQFTIIKLINGKYIVKQNSVWCDLN